MISDTEEERDVEAWHEVPEGRIVHGYDGWSLRLETRSIFGLLADNLWDKPSSLVSKVLRLASPIVGEETAELWSWQVVNWGMQLAWKLFPAHDIYHYPVSDQWVAHYRPDLLDWICVDIDNEKDPEWGTKCPVCGWGRVNDPNTTWIEHFEQCFQCALRNDATYGGHR